MLLEQFKNKKGFTLIEILLVLMIIGVLSTLAVAGYTDYRKNALLDLSIDGIISQIKEMRSKTIYGTFGEGKYEEIKTRLNPPEEDSEETIPEATPAMGNSDPKCFGLKVLKEDTYKLSLVSQQFSSKRVWKTGQGLTYEGCKEEGETPLNFEIDPMVQVIDVTLNGVSINEAVLRFFPPNGEWDLVSPSGNHTIEKGDKLVFNIRYGETEDARYERIFTYDLYEGKAMEQN